MVEVPVWTGATVCIGNLAPSQSGTLDNPHIGKAGRKFLADLLVQLSDAQLHDLFETPASHSERRRASAPPPPTNGSRRSRRSATRS